MVIRMKTTVIIDDAVMGKLKREAARQGRTMSEMIETALRLFLSPNQGKQDLPPLPTFDMGRPLVDYADRDALEEALKDE